MEVFMEIVYVTSNKFKVEVAQKILESNVDGTRILCFTLILTTIGT